ncbi:hypothetical protein XENOCAPTIV_029778, partial [Xenoophorus captivus]
CSGAPHGLTNCSSNTFNKMFVHVGFYSFHSEHWPRAGPAQTCVACRSGQSRQMCYLSLSFHKRVDNNNNTSPLFYTTFNHILYPLQLNRLMFEPDPTRLSCVTSRHDPTRLKI